MMEGPRSYSNVAGSTVTRADTGALDRSIRRPYTVRAYIPKLLSTRYPRTLRKQVVSAVMAAYRGTYVRCIQLVNSIAWITLHSAQHRDTFLMRGLSIDGLSIEIRGAESPVTFVQVHRLPCEILDMDLVDRLSEYGEVSLTGVERLRDPNWTSCETGSRVVKMVVKHPIPRSLSLRGWNFVVYYRGQPVVCRACGGPGHFARDCWAAGKCLACGEMGHKKNSCPTRVGSEQSEDPRTSGSESEREPSSSPPPRKRVYLSRASKGDPPSGHQSGGGEVDMDAMPSQQQSPPPPSGVDIGDDVLGHPIVVVPLGEQGNSDIEADPVPTIPDGRVLASSPQEGLDSGGEGFSGLSEPCSTGETKQSPSACSPDLFSPITNCSDLTVTPSVGDSTLAQLASAVILAHEPLRSTLTDSQLLLACSGGDDLSGGATSDSELASSGDNGLFNRPARVAMRRVVSSSLPTSEEAAAPIPSPALQVPGVPEPEPVIDQPPLAPSLPVTVIGEGDSEGVDVGMDMTPVTSQHTMPATLDVRPTIRRTSRQKIHRKKGAKVDASAPESMPTHLQRRRGAQTSKVRDRSPC
jgi:hypothetical protein